MAIGTVAITGVEESCVLQTIPTCVQIPMDHPQERIMVVTRTAKPQDREATGNVGNEVWFYLISFFMGLIKYAKLDGSINYQYVLMFFLMFQRQPMITVNDAAETELSSEYGPKMTRLI